MKKILYIFLAAIAMLASCQKPEMPKLQDSANDAPDKVTVTFPVAIPADGPATKAMATQPDVKNIFVAVFGGSGYFNEWVSAEVLPAENPPTEYATQNEVIYNLKVKLTVSPSRLNLHIIANSPLTEPPITGVSSNDLESVVMSKVRSHISKEPNDAYWAKIVLPFGIQDSTVVTNGVEQPFLVNGERYPTLLTQSQFTHWSPIPLVRNFARIKVKMATTLTGVQISHIGLAYAPESGSVAPILPNTFTSDQWGTYVNIPDSDDTTPFWNESFYIPYHSRTIENVGAAPYNYKGYTPADVELFNPESVNDMTPWSATTADNTYLYLYERAKPRPGQKNTRVLIRAKNGSEDWKFYPLDITDSNGDTEVFLRNYTYTVVIKNLAGGTGEPTIAAAVDATGADVSSDVRAADLTEVSDGIALIATSYIDTTAIKQGVYSVMYRFVPNVEATGVKEVNNPSSTANPVGVSLQVGYNNGVDGFVAGTTSANGSAFSVAPAIELNTDGTAKLYVRSGNGWAVATAAQMTDASIEKWGRINYTTATVDVNNQTALDTDGYYTKGFTQTIRVIGTKPAEKGGGQVYRDVQINLTPRKTMIVECLDKYIPEGTGEAETVRIYIPDDLTRSMFPLEFKIQPEATTLTPREGDNLPVSSGKSIIPGKTTQSAFFFIKTLSRQDYLGLSTTTIEGRVYKYFDCRFKSTRAASATTVYAQNEYFNTGSDDFFNYTTRLFAVVTGLGTITAGEEKPFTFSMDQTHGGTPVWNDAENPGNNRVIPRIVTITMTGVQPQVKSDGTLFDDGLVKGTGTGVYYYHVPAQGNGAPYNTNNANRVTLHLVGGNAENYSITLSTSQITPNPDLYEPLTVTGDVELHTVTGGFTNAAGTSEVTYVEKRAGEDVYFKLTYSSDPKPVSFTLTGLAPAADQDGITTSGNQYVFTPSGTGRTAILHFSTTDANSICYVRNLAVLSDDYSEPDPDTFSLQRQSRVWRTTSYTITINNNNYNTTNFTTQPQNVVFNNRTNGEGNNNNRYKIMGDRAGFILYAYYDGAFTITAPNLEGAKISGISMTYHTQGNTTYNSRTVTVAGDVSGSSTLTGNKTTWNSTSTGEGNGDGTVTVTMQCSSANDYNNRNRLTSLTVYYGYWVYE